jgi:tetratricopeptide (TPR) repeat protein
MSDPIRELCIVLLKIAQNSTESDLTSLVERVKTELDRNAELTQDLKADARMFQINLGQSTGFQVLVEADATAYIGDQYHFDAEKVVAGLGQLLDDIASRLCSREPFVALANLPSDINDFVGREAQQAILIEWLEQVNASGRTAPVIISISGMAGVGKSRLALRVLHRLKDLFPDGQVYLNLQRADQEPMSATQALFEVLRYGFGLEEKEIPLEQRGRECQYSSLMANRRVVVLLDNALDEAQVMPLRPPGGASALVVTSRERFELDGELLELKPMELGTGSELGEAEALLHEIVRRVSPKRVTNDVGTARQIVELCGRLPLAIRIAAATLKMPLWEREVLATYRDELAHEATRLTKLENERVDKAYPGQGRVRASFSLSYRILQADLQRLFRYMSGLPGQDFGLALAATAIDRLETETEAGLNCLVEAQVLELSNGRYRFHDLMRLFAWEKLESIEQEIVMSRALKWYCENAAFWENTLNPVRCRQGARVIAADTGDLVADLEQNLPKIALNYFETERGNWVAVMEKLARLDRLDKAVTLATNLVPFYIRCSHWRDWVTTHEIAKTCAEKAGNRASVALILGNLGMVYFNQGCWDEATAAHEQALQIKHELGNRHGEAETLNSLGCVYFHKGRWDEAISFYEQDLQISRELGDSHGEAVTLTSLGGVYFHKGQWDRAIAAHEQALQIERELGDRHGEAVTLTNLGDVYRNQERWDEAIAAHMQSLRTFRKLGDRHKEGQTLNNLGLVYADQKLWDEAITAYEQSLQISYELGDRYGVALTLGNLGIVHRNQEHWDEAIAAYEQSLQISRELGNRYGIAITYGNLGVLHEKQRCWDEAITAYEQSWQLARELGDYHGAVTTLDNLAVMYSKQERWDKAASTYEQSLQVSCEFGVSHDVAQTLGSLGLVYLHQGQRDKVAQTFCDLGLVYAKQGEWDEAIKAYEQALQISQELCDQEALSVILNNLGLVYVDQGRLNEAISAYEQSLQIKRELGDCWGEGQTLSNLGIAYADQGCWDEAILAYKQSLQVKRASGDRQGEGETLGSLGLASLNKGNLDDAIVAHEQSLQILREVGNRQREGQTICSLGLVYTEQRRWDEAISAFKQSLQISRELGDRRVEGQTLNNFGALYSRQESWDKAVSAYEQSLQISREFGDRYDVAVTFSSLGIVYAEQKEWDKAITAYQQSLQILHALGDRHRKGQILNKLGLTYAAKGQWEEAIGAYGQYLQIKRDLGDYHGEEQIWCDVIKLLKHHQPQLIQEVLQKELVKYHPSSLDFHRVQQMLGEFNQPQRSKFIHWLIPLGIAVFLVACLLKGQWLLSLGGVAIIGAIWWNKKIEHARIKQQ